jgi:hypothetical protein
MFLKLCAVFKIRKFDVIMAINMNIAVYCDVTP